MAAFEKLKKIRFGHTDPAGIMFYPRYFELLNEVVEDWFDEALGMSFGTLLDDHEVGAPLGDVHTRFMAPCRLGDRLKFTLGVTEVRRSTAKLVVTVSGDEGVRIRSKLVLVCAKKDMSGAGGWPRSVEDRMKAYLDEGKPR